MAYGLSPLPDRRDDLAQNLRFAVRIGYMVDPGEGGPSAVAARPASHRRGQPRPDAGPVLTEGATLALANRLSRKKPKRDHSQ